MIFWLLQLIATVPALLLSWLPFSDARQALEQGVFSTTSVSNYSITKSLIVYAAYLIGAAVVGYIYSRFFPAESKSKQITFDQPKIHRWEWLVVICLVVLFGILAGVFRGQIFDSQALYSEEFYNLSALIEFQQPHFDIVYPYSVGNLIVVAFLNKIGLGSISLKILLNTLALVVGFYAVSYVADTRRVRWVAYLWLLILYVQPLISLSLHRNLLRFLMPALFVIGLQHITNSALNLRNKIIRLSALVTALLFFGSADLIVLGGTLYLVHTCIYHYKRESWSVTIRNLVVPPGAAMLCMMLLVGPTHYLEVLVSQLSSIAIYSGYANTTPYFTFSALVTSVGVIGSIKQVIYGLCYYLPLVVMGGAIMFVVIHRKKLSFADDRFVMICLLTLAYCLYFRQNFGDAGVGRVAIASSVLAFILLVLKRFKNEVVAQYTVYTGVTFFVVVSLVSLYFFRYSVMDLAEAFKEKSGAGLVACSDTFAAKPLALAGYVWCDKQMMGELAIVYKAIEDKNIYIFDDTFSLYYLFGKRPMVLIPTYYMAYSRQDQLIEKMKYYRVGYLIYPMMQHFFGVPGGSLADERFMQRINRYRDEEFKPGLTLPHYQIFERK